MDSLKKTTRKIFGGGKKDNLRGIHTACRAGTGGSKVFIRVFDRDGLVRDILDSGGLDPGEQVRQALEDLFNNLAATPGLPAPVVQDLQTFSFEVTYLKGSPTDAERDAFGMMDFPLYLESTVKMTPSEGRRLLSAHRIPEETFVRVDTGETGVALRPVKPFKDVEEILKDDGHSEPGAGVPGTYDEQRGVQTMCRKVGLIKVNVIKENNPVTDVREKKFIAAIKHELGHMFGLGHHAGTLMDEKLNVAILPGNESFTVGQVQILRQVLNMLRRH